MADGVSGGKKLGIKHSNSNQGRNRPNGCRDPLALRTARWRTRRLESCCRLIAECTRREFESLDAIAEAMEIDPKTVRRLLALLHEIGVTVDQNEEGRFEVRDVDHHGKTQSVKRRESPSIPEKVKEA